MRKNRVLKRRKTGSQFRPIKPALLTLTIAQTLVFQAVQAASIEVTSNLDDGTGCTIREAIDTVNAGVDQNNGCIINGALGTADTVSFVTGVAGSTIVTNGELVINQDVSINPGGVNTTIDANGVGRDIGVSSNTVELDHLTLTGGNCLGNGGGIYADRSSVTLTNSTVSGNTAERGGGIFAWYSSVTLSNSIVANSIGPDCTTSSSTVTATADSVIEDGSCGNTAMWVDPVLGPLADNGGPTQIHALLTGSPAINKGDPGFTPPPAELDQRSPGEAGKE